MSKKSSITIGLLIVFCLLLISSILIVSMYKDNKSRMIPLTYQSHAIKNVEIDSKYFERNISIAAIGDILIHDRVYEHAKIKKGYDFKPMLAPIKSILLKPDLLLANQETILGGVELGISSYPLFNSPQEVGDALVDAGVDIVSTANNHALDKGEKGQLASIRYLDKINLPHVGTYKSKEEQQKLIILTKNDIKVAFLSYSYGTNGIPVPQGKDYLVNLINKKKMKDEIQRAKLEADVIVISLHWGNEYERYPTEDQKKLAQFLCNEGVDIIFGHHPHVLQPIDWIKTNDGRKSLVVYSLGNFLSGQIWDYKDLGGMVNVQVKKEVVGHKTNITIGDVSFSPTYMTGAKYQYKVVPLTNAGSYGLQDAEGKYKEIMHHMVDKLK